MNNNREPFVFLKSAAACGESALTLTRGQTLPELISEDTTSCISVHGSFIIYFIVFPNMTDEEKEQFKNGDLKVRVVSLKGEMFLLIKNGNLPWSDIAFAPQLSEIAFTGQIPEQYTFVIIPVDGIDGKIQGIHLRSVDPQFSAHFNQLVKEQLNKPFSIQKHYKNVQDVFNQYTTKQLLKYAL